MCLRPCQKTEPLARPVSCAQYVVRSHVNCWQMPQCYQRPLVWFVRSSVPISAILISAEFFVSMGPPTATEPNRAVALIYLRAASLNGPLSNGLGHFER